LGMRWKLSRGTAGLAVGTVTLALLGGAASSVPAADLPSVDVPSLPSGSNLPSVPALQKPSVPDAPSLPQAPAAPRVDPQISLPRAPELQAPSAGTNTGPGSTRSSPQGVGGGPASPTPSGSSGASVGSGSSASTQGERAGTSRTKTGSAGRASYERRLDSTVARLQGCFYAVSRLERRVLRLRAGVADGRGLSRAELAHRLGVSTVRVRRIERQALHSLREADRSDGCGRVSLGLHAESGARILVAAGRNGPSLQPVANLSSTGRSPARASKRGAVLGAHKSSPAREGRKDSTARLAIAAGEPSGAGDGARLAYIVAGLLLLTAVLLLFVRPWRQSRGAKYAFPSPMLPPTPPAEAEREERVAEPEDQAWVWPSRPGPAEAVHEKQAGSTDIPPPPWSSRREPPEPRRSETGPRWPSRPALDDAAAQGPRWPSRPTLDDAAAQGGFDGAAPQAQRGNGNGANTVRALASGVALVVARAVGQRLRRRR
jgi:hypothetical protein